MHVSSLKRDLVAVPIFFLYLSTQTQKNGELYVSKKKVYNLYTI